MMPTKNNQASTETAPYWEQFERFVKDWRHPAWLRTVRQGAIARFAELGFPTLRDEDWRFTNVAPIARLPFKPAFAGPPEGLPAEVLAQFTFTTLAGPRLVFVNGQYSAKLSSVAPGPGGIKLGSIAEALAGDSALLEPHLAHYARTDDNAFAALNTAFFNDGAFIIASAGTTVVEPVQLLFISTAREPGEASHPRNLIIAEAGSRLTVVENYVSTADAPYLTNAVTELVVGDQAVVEHCKFQDESLEAFHIATLQVHLGRGANFIGHSIATGARLSRNNINTTLAAEGVECVLNGLYLTRRDQLADHHMIVDHAQPRCNSHEYYNGILDDHSKGVFHGRILVRPDAQKTDAKQTNKNLLLSESATIDTKPQLEIYADDVKCTHGATIGQLNEESIFYLRARGIGAETARRMLIHAFAGEIIDRIRHAPAREELDKIIWERLEANPVLAEKK